MSMRAFLVPNTRPGTRIDAMYSIPVDGMGNEELEDEKRRLTLQAKSNFGPPVPPFAVFKIEDGRLCVPRFYGMQRYGPAETDARSEGEPVRIQFDGELREVQQKAMDSMFTGFYHSTGIGGAMTVLPCGFGKTVLAVATASRLGRKTAVLVHTTVLKTQWKNSFESFCPGVRVGYVQGTTYDVEDKDVVIMMVQTVAKRQFSFEMTDAFGFLICDEAHHMGAPVMNQALRCFRAKHILALTATKERVDGLTHLLHWSLGPEAFRAERDTEAAMVTIVKYEGGGVRDKKSKDGCPLVAVMLNHLGVHERRNRFIAERVHSMHRNGRTIIVLSHRCAQLNALRSMLEDLVDDPSSIGMLKSGLTESQREVQMSRPILLCSYNMADEGLDKKTLDTCVMATPKSRVEQCIGRIQRPCETKQPPLVVDIADEGDYFGKLRMARENFYRRSRYQTQAVSANDPIKSHWFA